MAQMPALWIGIGEFGRDVLQAVVPELAVRRPDLARGGTYLLLAEDGSRLDSLGVSDDGTAKTAPVMDGASDEDVARALVRAADSAPERLGNEGIVPDSGLHIFVIAALADMHPGNAAFQEIGRLCDYFGRGTIVMHFVPRLCCMLSGPLALEAEGSESSELLRGLNQHLLLRHADMQPQAYLFDAVSIRRGPRIADEATFVEAATLLALMILLGHFSQADDPGLGQDFIASGNSPYGDETTANLDRLPAYATVAIRSVEYPASALIPYCAGHSFREAVTAITAAEPAPGEIRLDLGPAVDEIGLLAKVPQPVLRPWTPGMFSATGDLERELDQRLSPFPGQVSDWLDRMESDGLAPYVHEHRTRAAGSFTEGTSVIDQATNTGWMTEAAPNVVGAPLHLTEVWLQELTAESNPPRTWGPVPRLADAQRVSDRVHRERSALVRALKARPSGLLLLLVALAAAILALPMIGLLLPVIVKSSSAQVLYAVLLAFGYALVISLTTLLRHRNRLRRHYATMRRALTHDIGGMAARASTQAKNVALRERSALALALTSTIRQQHIRLGQIAAICRIRSARARGTLQPIRNGDLRRRLYAPPWPDPSALEQAAEGLKEALPLPRLVQSLRKTYAAPTSRLRSTWKEAPPDVAATAVHEAVDECYRQISDQDRMAQDEEEIRGLVRREADTLVPLLQGVRRTDIVDWSSTGYTKQFCSIAPDQRSLLDGLVPAAEWKYIPMDHHNLVIFGHLVRNIPTDTLLSDLETAP